VSPILQFPALEETIDLIVVMTYCVVLFSIVVQGLTIGKLFEKANADLKSTAENKAQEAKSQK